MQSICSVIPAEFNQQVIDARAELSQDPLLGAIYDPPFAHFTHQLAEDYDWEGLEKALSEFAKTHKPIEARTSGLLCMTGNVMLIAVAVFRSPEVVAYHNELWEVVSPFAKGNLRPLDRPETWLPHITIKRCGQDRESFGRAMARLADHNFLWSMTIDNVCVQHGPGENSPSYYQRLRFPLGGGGAKRYETETNAAIVSIDNEGPGFTLLIQSDDGAETSVEVTSPEMVRLMADCNASTAHFAGGRCRLEGGRIAAVAPNTPNPVMV